MSETICRKCQTPNAAHNKFCAKCGARLLPATHLVCPSCYQRNALNRLHCEHCGTRLIGTSTLDPLTLGEESAGGPIAVPVPDWLNSDTGAGNTAVSSPPQPTATPNWLNAEPAQPAQPPRKPATTLLNALNAEPVAPTRQQPQPASPPPPTPASAPTPPPDPPAKATPSDDLFDFDFGDDLMPSENLAEELGATSPDTTGFTAWLNPSTVEKFEQTSSASKPTPSQPEDDADDAGLPSWLRGGTENENDDLFGLGDFATVSDASAPLDTPSTGFTDWLPPLNEEEEPAVSTSFFTSTPTPQEPEEEENVPDWLKTPSHPPQESLSENPSLTNWLEGRAVPTETADDLPDWLRDPAAGQDAQPNTAVDSAQTGFTAWLRETPTTTTTPTPTEPDLPDWLQEPDTPLTPPAAVATGFTGIFAATDTPDDEPEAIPAWLAGIDAPPTTNEFSTGLTGLLDDDFADDDDETTEVSTGFTSWLTPDSAPEPTPAPPTDDGGDLPDWLFGDTTPTKLATALAGADDIGATTDEEDDGTGFTDWLLESAEGGNQTPTLVDQDLFNFDDDDDALPEFDLTPLTIEEAEQYLAETPEVSEDFIEKSVGEDFPDWLVDVETITPDTGALKLPSWMAEPLTGTDELELDFPTNTPASAELAWLDKPDGDGFADDEDFLSNLDKPISLTSIFGAKPPPPPPVKATPASQPEPDDDGGGDDWLDDFAGEDAAEEESKPRKHTDWLGQVTAEVSQASNRMSWLSLDDDEAEADADELSTIEATSPSDPLAAYFALEPQPAADDLTEREMPSWLSGKTDEFDDIEDLLGGSSTDSGADFGGLEDDWFATPSQTGFTEFDLAETATPSPANADNEDDEDDLWLPAAAATVIAATRQPSPAAFVDDTDTSEELGGDLDWLSDLPGSSGSRSQDEDDWLGDMGRGSGRGAVTAGLSWFAEPEPEPKPEPKPLPEPEPALEPEPLPEPDSLVLGVIDPSLDFDSTLEAFAAEGEAEDEEGLDWLSALEESGLEQIESEAEADQATAEADPFGLLVPSAAVAVAAITAVDSTQDEDEDEDDLFAGWSGAQTTDEPDEADGALWLGGDSTAVSSSSSTASDTDDLYALLETSSSETSTSGWEGWQEEFSEAELEEESDSGPSWLDDLTDEEEEEPVQMGGPLDGLKGVITVAPMLAQPITRVNPLQSNSLQISPAHTEQAQLWQEIVRTEFQAVPATAVSLPPRSAPARRSWLALLVTVGLIAAVLLGLFLPILPALLGVAPAPPTAQLTAVHTAISQASGQPVVVAFDYPPATSPELDQLALLLLTELAANDSPILLISQHPAGMANAEQLITAVPTLADHPLYPIGFLPGDAVGLRQLSACLDLPSCTTITGQELGNVPLPETALFILLTSEQENLINWLEQIAQPSDIPLILAVSESLAPVARTYQQAGQAEGLLVGLPSAATYATTYQPSATSAVRLLEARTVAQLLALLVLIGGLIWGLLPARTVPTAKPEAADTVETSPEEPNEIL